MVFLTTPIKNRSKNEINSQYVIHSPPILKSDEEQPSVNGDEPNNNSSNSLETDNFDEMIYMEVGAIMVGKIVNLDKKKFKKGEEKGYFKLGGSTIVILLKENTIKIDEDILENSKKDIEVKVKYREKIGTIAK